MTASEKSLAVLFVDDDALTRKIFAGVFGGEFTVVTAASAAEAIQLLSAGDHEYAVLLTDFQMPGGDGVNLLRAAQRLHRHVVRLLVSAYAEKDVAIAAVNQGGVMRILEKPLASVSTREVLREAMELYVSQRAERVANERRASALREMAGFLAHELNTPLATVRGSVAAITARHIPDKGSSPGNIVSFREDQPGEVLAALARAERRALYCQSLVSTFVQSARDAYPGATTHSVKASGLVADLLGEFPFEDDEHSLILHEVQSDFELGGRRDLLYLVLCTLTKNALQAMRGHSGATLTIIVGNNAEGHGHILRFVDTGPGIPQDVLGRLTREPLTTKSSGNGMGLVFCRRVMESVGGTIVVASELGKGTTVTLDFKPVALTSARAKH
ncbi:ATP-binding protein [Caenimonas koreensis]|uniref:ATP-binding protein n=1 Tax=Caenimonas koreensis TaxID=367474 RepID=UPI003784B625